MATLDADFRSHHIEGFARAALEAGRDGAFSVPLISHIRGNLWMGGCIGGVSLGDEFRHVVSLYPWEQYRLGADTQRIEIRLYDAAEIPNPQDLHDVAKRVNEFLKDGPTLVHCQAGLNRSGLVSALALILDGMAPADAIDLLRQKRSPVVLCNATFEFWLLEQVQ